MALRGDASTEGVARRKHSAEEAVGDCHHGCHGRDDLSTLAGGQLDHRLEQVVLDALQEREILDHEDYLEFGLLLIEAFAQLSHHCDELHRLDPEDPAEALVANLVEYGERLVVELWSLQISDQSSGRLRKRLEFDRGELDIEIARLEFRGLLTAARARLIDDPSQWAAVAREPLGIHRVVEKRPDVVPDVLAEREPCLAGGVDIDRSRR